MSSKYDPNRDTVGKIYRDLNLKASTDSIECGDMSRELTRDLVTDINDAIEQFDKREIPYYLMIHEKKDLQMKKAFLRRILYFTFRPYPEDDTIVYYKNPKTQELRFCWCLPHWSDMDNILATPHLYPKEYVFQIKKWKEYDLKPFGFYYLKDEDKWLPNPKWKDLPHDYFKTKKMD